MMLACPSCDTRFRVDPAAIGNGRTVRCSRCARKWHATVDQLLSEDETGEPTPSFASYMQASAPVEEPPLPEEVAAPEAVDEVDSEPDFDALEADMRRRRRSDARPAPAVTTRTRNAAPRGWMAAASVLVLLNLVAAVYAFRDPLLHHAGFGPLYDLLGYGDTAGLKLGDVQLTPSGEGKERAFDIAGSIYNTTERPQPYPVVEVSMLGAEGTVLQAWRFQTDEIIPPGKAHIFRSRPEKKLTSYYVDKAEAFRIRLGSPRELGLRP